MSSAPHELVHTTIATWTLAIQRALQGYGIEAEPLMLEAGIDPASVLDPEFRVAVVNMWKLWRLSVERTGNDAFGLQVAANLYPTHLNAMVFALQASATLREALQRLQRYVQVVTTIAEIEVNEGPQGVALILGSDSSTSAQRPYFPIDAFMGVLFRTFRELLGACAADGLLEVHLRRPVPQQRDAFEQFFGVPLHFGAEANVLLMASGMLDRELPAANAMIAGMNEQLLRDYLGRMRHEQVSLQVRKEIIALLSTDQFGLEQIAERLNMSGRNLHRKLAEEGTSFKELQDEIRHDLALRYLGMPGMSLNEIAFSLGFIDQSSFNRAFKRWTGGSPGQYRRERKAR
ncbi:MULTISPECIES: AraC family transcriptional regulator [Pseudomonas]|uniref:AraC family transcriptional regulator n=1 Tax=Pseudomonas TaxID=286 RepID=UPI00103B139C|nr:MULTISPECIES: AraC family transcriptional regulator [Pseudomonas]MBG7279477.1 AraC family transcriptional regulator [Pseudomonas aeruginosa]MDI3827802.1 AraC family transcriptional regulator [Pseudomonas aeruginosa]MDU0575357.1 AraC family transcriptional regulator [Pseudomonas aeruginosa]MDU0653989.1 AraC family transcriptional regulator [Pseudomonas aeruginosa]QXE12578.1 AraC family transcriptional regulator [Pseudomonas sp. AN-B15]